MPKPLLPAAALLATLAAAPLAAQTFISPACPEGSARIGNDCVAPNGTVTQRFELPQVTDSDAVVVYDLTSDSASGLNSLAGPRRVVIRQNSIFVTDLDTRMTVISD